MSKLNSLIEYYRGTRQVGHTTLMLTGLSFNRPCVVLAASTQHARVLFNQMVDMATPELSMVDRSSMQIGQVRVRSISWLMGEHLAYNLPVVVDHFALDVLYHEHYEEVLKQGFYAGQAVAGVKLEKCHKNYKRWSMPEHEKQRLKNE